MGFIVLRCPSCGADIQLDESHEFGFCSYCGTRIIQEKTVIEHTGKVSVDGIAGESSLLERAFLYIEDGKYIHADRYLEKVLDVNPKCSKAYWGKILCQFECKTNVDLIDVVSKPLDCDSNYVNAIRFGNAEEQKEYISINNLVKNQIIEQIDAINNKINATTSKIEQLNTDIQILKNKKSKAVPKKIVSGFYLVVLIFFFAVFLLMFLVSIFSFKEEYGVGMLIFASVFLILFTTLLVRYFRKINIKKRVDIEIEYAFTELNECQNNLRNYENQLFEKKTIVKQYNL